MPRFVVYEIWTKATTVEAESVHDAYAKGEPEPRDDMSLCNWHVVPIDEPVVTGAVGGLNYRQITE